MEGRMEIKWLKILFPLHLFFAWSATFRMINSQKKAINHESPGCFRYLVRMYKG